MSFIFSSSPNWEPQVSLYDKHSFWIIFNRNCTGIKRHLSHFKKNTNLTFVSLNSNYGKRNKFRYLETFFKKIKLKDIAVFFANRKWMLKGSVKWKLRYMLLYIIRKLSSKGKSHEIFCTRFFPQTTPPGPIRDVLGPFWIFLLLGWVISILKWLPGAWDTGESPPKPSVRKNFQICLNLIV